MKKTFFILLMLILALSFFSFGYAAPFVDAIEYPTNYFLDTDANRNSSPFYRWYNEDWGWSHNPIGNTFTTATLEISAFDVDAASGEVDKIYVGADINNLTYIGDLAGADDVWNYSTFDVSGFGPAISSGLYVWMDIDSNNTQDWAVTLAKSVLSLDGGEIPGAGPGPDPDPAPEPVTILLLGSGLIGLAGLARKSFRK